MRNFVAFVLLLSLFEPSRAKSRPEKDKLKVIPLEHVLESDVKPIKLSDIVESIEYIPLESKEDSYLGDIKKMVVTDRGYYFGNMEPADKVIHFDKNGRYVYKIDKVGKGPGEYTDVEGFVVDEKGRVHVYSGSNQKMLVYDNKGESFKENLFPYAFLDFGYLPSLGYGVSCYRAMADGQPAKNVWVVAKDGKVKKGYLPFDPSENDYLTSPMPNMKAVGGELHFMRLIDNSIYAINAKGDLVLRYKPDFGKHGVTLEEMREINRESTSFKSYRDRLKRDEIATLAHFFEADNHLVLLSELNHRMFLSFISKRTGKMVYGGLDRERANATGKYNIIENDIDGVPMFMISQIEGDYMYVLVDAMTLAEDRGFQKSDKSNIHEVAGKVDEEGNPVVARLKLKRL